MGVSREWAQTFLLSLRWRAAVFVCHIRTEPCAIGVRPNVTLRGFEWGRTEPRLVAPFVNGTLFHRANVKRAVRPPGRIWTKPYPIAPDVNGTLNSRVSSERNPIRSKLNGWGGV